MKLFKSTILLASITGMLMGSLSAFSADRSDRGKKLAIDRVEGTLSVMVLGSGGPVATPSGRASSGYIIFTGKTPRLFIDTGGGTFKSLAQSGTTIPDVSRFLLTHLHLDHTGDMSAIVKTLYFHNRGAGKFRTAPLKFYGPETNNVPFPPASPAAGVAQYPDTTDYVDGHYDNHIGLERYLNAFATGIEAGKFSYTVDNLPSDFTDDTITTVFTEPDGLKVSSIAVNHGPAPAVAYRVDYKGYSIVYTGDTTSKTENVTKLATGADILIYDTAIMDDAPPLNSIFHKLHTTPTRMGAVVAAAKPKKLVLSHITPVTEPRLKEVKAIVRSAGYKGRIKSARDLKVYNLGVDHHHYR